MFVAVGLALLAVALILFSKGTSLFHGTYTLRLQAGNVGGLKRGANVLLAGVQVGSVADIDLAGNGKSVSITLNIYKRYQIFSDARFVIEQQGFLGDQYVAVIPTVNQGHVLADKEEVQCQEPFNLQEVARGAAGFIQHIDTVAKKLDDTVNQMQQNVLNTQTMTNFAVAVENMRSFSEQAMQAVNEINQLVATNGTTVSMAVSNFYLLSSDLRGPLAASATNIQTSTEILTNVMMQIQSGKGLAGTVLQNQQLATNVEVIANNLAVASSNLNRLGLWHFLWYKQEPPKKSGAKK